MHILREASKRDTYVKSIVCSVLGPRQDAAFTSFGFLIIINIILGV